MADTVKEGKLVAQLYDLAITERKDDYAARIVTRESRSVEDLARLVVAARTDLNLNTLITSYNLLKEVAIQELINGSNVQFGLGIDGLVISGTFIGTTAQFDPAVHKISVSHTLTSDVREALKRVQITVLGPVKNDPVIGKAVNVATEEVNQTITPGGGLNLEGSRIRIEGEDETVGIRFRPFGGGEAVEAAHIAVGKQPLGHLADCSRRPYAGQLQPGTHHAILPEQRTVETTALDRFRTRVDHHRPQNRIVYRPLHG